MTAVDNALLAGAGGGNAGNAVAGNGSVSDLFMTLLVAQIRNQDPLSPMESKDFINQFASMTQVETMQTLSSLTSSSAALQESMLVVNLGAQVGSDMMVAAGGVSLDGEPVKGAFVLQSGATDVALLLTGADGNTHRIAMGPQDAGTINFSIDPRQHGLVAGRYTLKIETGSGEAPRAELQGRLLGVRLDAQGRVVLDVSASAKSAPATSPDSWAATAAPRPPRSKEPDGPWHSTSHSAASTQSPASSTRSATTSPTAAATASSPVAPTSPRRTPRARPAACTWARPRSR